MTSDEVNADLDDLQRRLEIAEENIEQLENDSIKFQRSVILVVERICEHINAPEDVVYWINEWLKQVNR